MERKGLLIAVEGPDGAGKTSTIEELRLRFADYLAPRYKVHVHQDPGGTPLGMEIRKIVKTQSVAHGARASLLLFLAARAQLWEDCIRPQLENGDVVIVDRWELSTLVYQGLLGPLGLEYVRSICAAVFPLQVANPDHYLVLDAPDDVLWHRITARAVPGEKDVFEANKSFALSVAHMYRAAAALVSSPVTRLVNDGKYNQVQMGIRAWETTVNDRMAFYDRAAAQSA